MQALYKPRLNSTVSRKIPNESQIPEHKTATKNSDVSLN